MNDDNRPHSDPASEALSDLVRESLDEKRRARRWNTGFRIFYAVIAAVALVVLIGHGSSGGVSPKGPHTALVRIEGVIEDGGDASADRVVDALEDAFGSPHVKGIVLQIDSPGGSPVQSDLIYREIRRQRALHKDIAVHTVVLDLCASGGYYIASAADRIYVNPSSVVGSIGVIMNGFGFTGAMERFGVERRVLTAGENKAFLDPFSPAKPDEVAHARKLLDDIHANFIAAVKAGRGDRLKDDGKLFGGLMWTGKQAIELGLADAVGSTASVARDVFKAEEVVDYTPQPDLAEKFAKRFGAAAGQAMAKALGGLSIR
jgi:protease-4